MTNESSRPFSPVVIIDPELWTAFTLWAHGRGFVLTDITEGDNHDGGFYRLHVDQGVFGRKEAQ